MIEKELSYKIVGALYSVYNEMGYGYKEKIYENAVATNFVQDKIKYIRQAPFKVAYKGEIVGRCFIDFVVEGRIVLELKIGKYFSRKNIYQVKEYLKVTNLPLAIIANFTPDGVRFLRVLNPNN